MPFASIPPAEPVTRRDRRAVLIVAVVLVVIFGGIGIWALVRPGAYGASGHGCITVKVPSTTGGGLLHSCDGQARSACRRAYAGQGQAPALTRAQCRIAGIRPPG